MGLFIFWLLCAVLAAMIAHSRGGSAIGGFILGLILGPFGIGIAFFLGSPQEREARAIRKGQLRKCPHCAEVVRGDARICRYCHGDLTPAAAAPGVDPAAALPPLRPARSFSWRAGDVLTAGLAVLAVGAAAIFMTRPHVEPSRTSPSEQQCRQAEVQIMTVRTGSDGQLTNPSPGVLEGPQRAWQQVRPLEQGATLGSLAIQNACDRQIRTTQASAIVREAQGGRPYIHRLGGVDQLASEP